MGRTREPTGGAGAGAGSLHRPRTDLPDQVEASRATGWVAWILLAAVLLVLLGAVHLGMGLVALFRPEILAVGRSEELLSVGEDALAAVHLVLGAVAVITGVGLVPGRRWARAVAVVLAGVAGMVNFTFVSVHPVWGVTAMALAVAVIYAIVAHGAELADAYAG
jgi:hypothetical protein